MRSQLNTFGVDIVGVVDLEVVHPRARVHHLFEARGFDSHVGSDREDDRSGLVSQILLGPP